MNQQEINNYIGSKLKSIRVARGYSLSSLGKKLEPPITQQQVAKYEAGDNRISAPTLYNMCQILRVSPLEFLIPDNEHPVFLEADDAKLLKSYSQIKDEDIKKAVRVLVKDLASYFENKKDGANEQA